ncbi:MAG: YdcF family protein [Candidatus Daviesbacteria bacterium]|nr:MAG: YdcF family protein [Candidatus Daviesbacteria bacterium]
MPVILLFSYAILPKKLYKLKQFRYNSHLHPLFSLTGLSALETYAGYLLAEQILARKIIILGCRTFGKETPADSELMAIYLNKLGMSKNKITVCKNGINTVYQIEEAQKILKGHANNVYAVTLECHQERTRRLLEAYGIKSTVFSIEEIFKHSKRSIPKDLFKLLHSFKTGRVEKLLIKESRLLLWLQFIDSKGWLQKLATNLRGIRYFDVDILPTLEK